MKKLTLSVKYLTQENERLAKLLMEKGTRLRKACEMLEKSMWAFSTGDNTECVSCHARLYELNGKHFLGCKLKLWLEGNP